MEPNTIAVGTKGNLHGQVWDATHDPKGVLIVVHGLGDHIGRYDRLAKHFVAERWIVCAFDLPGHGRSPGKRGRVGDYASLLADLATVRTAMANRYPKQHQAILGHSMGGNLVLNYALRESEFATVNAAPAALILASPMILPPGHFKRTEILAAWLTGHLFPRRRIRKPVLPDKLTRDAAAAKAHIEDPLTHSRIGLKLGTQLLSQGRWALDHAREIETPTLITFGSADQLIDQSACHSLAMRMGAGAELKVWHDMRHDLFHEIDHQQVSRLITDWLDHQVIPNASS